MISFDNVSFQYNNENESLRDVSLFVKKGEVVLVCGPSGCGKSTLVRCVNGLIPHFYQGKLTGNVTVDGINVSETTLRKI
nr:ATP-binding cassette domain-containing protein [Lachnospiraceae bacterium]